MNLNRLISSFILTTNQSILYWYCKEKIEADKYGGSERVAGEGEASLNRNKWAPATLPAAFSNIFSDSGRCLRFWYLYLQREEPYMTMQVLNIQKLFHYLIHTVQLLLTTIARKLKPAYVTLRSQIALVNQVYNATCRQLLCPTRKKW